MGLFARRLFSCILIVQLLIGPNLVSVGSSVHGDGSIHIRADGSIDPQIAPINTIDKTTYILTGDIFDTIVVERNNIVIDGRGYKIQGTSGFNDAIYLPGIKNVTIKNTHIDSWFFGVFLEESCNISLSGNTINNSTSGVDVYSSANISLSGNTVSKCPRGVSVRFSSNVLLSGNTIDNTHHGFHFSDSSNITLSGNSINNSDSGVCLEWSSNLSLFGNSINNSNYGIELYESPSNSISGNTIDNCNDGIHLHNSSNNRIYHNNFLNNVNQVYDWAWYEGEPMNRLSINTWDNGYPSGGNYWNYLGVDMKSGPNQDQLGSDGIADLPYTIDDCNQDRYPLILKFQQFSQLGPISISPNRGGNNGMVTAWIFCQGVTEVVAVALTRDGYPQIEGTHLNPLDSSQVGSTVISTRFNLIGREPGLWDLLVELPNSTELKLRNAFTIELGGQPKLWVNSIGRSAIRFGENATYYIQYGNDGEIDAFDVNLVLRIPSELEFKVLVSPSILSGFDLAQVPLGSLVSSHVVISHWIYSVPAFSTGLLCLTIQAPFTPGQFKVRAELWQSKPNNFTQTGDFSFANESSIFFELVNTYPILYAANLATMTTTDFANGLLTWLQVNQEEIGLVGPVPNAFLSVAAAKGVLGIPLSDIAIELLVDPLASTGSPGAWYGNWCGPGPEPQDWNGDGRVTPDDYNAQAAPPAKDELDKACKNHDYDYNKIINLKTNEMGIGGARDVFSRVGGADQDAADLKLVMAALDFDPSTTYLTQTLGPVLGPITADYFRNALVGIFLGAAALLPENKYDAASDFHVAGSIDPNDKAGPSGFGSQRFVPSGRKLLYVIFFENLESATAPAEKIVITDQLDSNLDWNSLEFGETSHPQYAVKSFDSVTGTISWSFTGINLPPNRIPPQGEGWVIFTINPKSNLPSGTEIRNKATIVFDFNPPIDTPVFLNTIDSQPPDSDVNALPSQQSPTFEISWSGTDNAGSGIKDYTIYVSDNNGVYTPLLQHATNQSATFTGEKDHTYSFYSIARDKVGNTEEPPAHPDTTTMIVVAADGVPLWMIGVAVLIIIIIIVIIVIWWRW